MLRSSLLEPLSPLPSEFPEGRWEQLAGLQLITVFLPKWWACSTSETYLSSVVSRRHAWRWMLPNSLLVVFLLQCRNLPDAAVMPKFCALSFVTFVVMAAAGAVLPATSLLSDVLVSFALGLHFIMTAVKWHAFAAHLELYWLWCQVILGIHSSVAAAFLGIVVVFVDETQALTSLVLGLGMVAVSIIVEARFADLCMSHQESDDLLFLMLDTCDGFCTIQRSSANQRFQDAFGGASSNGKPFIDLVRPDDKCQINTLFRSGLAVCAPEVVTCLRPASEGELLEGLSAHFEVKVIAHATTCLAILERAHITSARTMEQINEDDEVNWDVESSMAYTEHSLTCSQSSMASTQHSSARSRAPSTSSASSKFMLAPGPQFNNLGTQKDEDTTPIEKARTVDIGIQTNPFPNKVAL